jgi:hypothetical protein
LNTPSSKPRRVENGIFAVIETACMTYAEVFLNETYDRVRVGKHLSDMFPVKNGLKQGAALSPLLLKFELDMPLGGLR